MGGQGEGMAWREQVLEQTLRWANRLGLVLATIGIASILRTNPERLAHPAVLLMLAAFSSTFLLSHRPSLSYRRRAQLFCWLILTTGVSSVAAVGLLPGAVLCNTLAVVCAGLFLGRRTMWLLLAVSSLGIALLGGWNAAHYAPALPASLPLAGFRFGAGYGLVTAAVALLVEHVVRQIEHSLRATSEALRRLSIAEEERRRAEHTLAETESALQRSQKLEAVGRLAAGVGHDFNNSLQVVLSWSSLLQGETDPAQLEEGLNAIQQAALQGSELTQRLLTFGRRDVRAPRNVNVSQLLADSARSLRRMLPEDIVIDVQSDGATQVLADSAQLSHILLNLGLNARDAMQEGGQLTLGTRRLTHAELPPGPSWPSEPHSWVAISVRDSGVGMSQDTQSHIFEPFFSTKGERGNGLGLATSYALAEQNRGFIRVESQLGRGTTIELYFPEHSAEVDDVAAPVRSQRASAGLRVMVAEDDDNVRSSLVHALGSAGFRVYESADAASAIQLLERVGGPVDVLCTDGIMPGGGTRELIDRYLARQPEGKVIVCSGYVKEELLRRQIDAGSLAYLAKPFLPSELIDRIHGLLQPSSARSAPVQSTVRASSLPAVRIPRAQNEES
ncbi:MAG: hypothetical protein RL033_1646 [Pseudomonadota bacterium]